MKISKKMLTMLERHYEKKKIVVTRKLLTSMFYSVDRKKLILLTRGLRVRSCWGHHKCEYAINRTSYFTIQSSDFFFLLFHNFNSTLHKLFLVFKLLEIGSVTMLNLSGIANVGRLFFKPSLCMPQMVAKEFLDIPIPICIPGLEKQRIRGIVVDKDNCLAQDQLNIIWPQYEVCFTY